MAKPGEKIKAPIFIRRKGADSFRPALAAGGSLMAYKCLSLCGLFSFFKGLGENLFHAGFQLIQIEGRPLHGKTENLLLFRVGEIALVVLEHSLGFARISWGGAIFPPNRNVTCWVSSTNLKRKPRKSFTATSTL